MNKDNFEKIIRKKNQTLKIIFHYITKHQKIIYFFKIYFFRIHLKKYFSANK
jgi:hypothetical protein